MPLTETGVAGTSKEENEQRQSTPKNKKPIGIIGVAKSKEELNSLLMTTPSMFIKKMIQSIIGCVFQAILISLTVQYLLCGSNASFALSSQVIISSKYSVGSVSNVTGDLGHQESLSQVTFGVIPAILNHVKCLAETVISKELSYRLFQISNKNILWVVLYFTHVFGYFAINWFFYGFLCHFLGMCERYRVERSPKTVPSMSLVVKTVTQGIIAIFLINPFTSYLFANYAVDVSSTVCREPLDISRIALLTVAAMFINETLFYFVHRLAHEVPFIYKHIHKKHHEYIGTICIAAEYAHPLEELFANQLPTLAVFMIFSDIPVVFVAAWILIRLNETYEAHSGYCFVGSIAAKLCLVTPFHQAQHDFHHVVNKGNYGTSLLWDYVLGTDLLYTKKMIEGKF
eukprot:Tbor_TRINITY_DN3747_c0_g1::TRINITY_DN3747_c0_g1_i1::g.2458::m.2458/K07750/E1.14.13.72, SC4MOL, ERG25; methylsterol monooxygenase